MNLLWLDWRSMLAPRPTLTVDWQALWDHEVHSSTRTGFAPNRKEILYCIQALNYTIEHGPQYMSVGICHNISEILDQYMDRGRIFGYSVIAVFQADWPLSESPGRGCCMPIAIYDEDECWVGEGLALRLDLMRHVRNHLIMWLEGVPGYPEMRK